MVVHTAFIDALRRRVEVFSSFLYLGMTSFGGPIAHLGYFSEEFVRRRRWIDDATFARVVSLCMLLPGPTSSQVGIVIGWMRAGWSGAVLAWLAFTLPSAIVLTAFAFWSARTAGFASAAWVHGLLVSAVAVVALAVVNMFRTICKDAQRGAVAMAACAAVMALPVGAYAQLAVIALGALCGLCLFKTTGDAQVSLPIEGNRWIAGACAAVFCALLIGFPIADALGHSSIVNEFGTFYESGALVFGGGHVVLPLLESRVVPPGWITPHAFMAGYGAAQAVPGPLFTFAAYLGAAMHGPVGGFAGAALALFAIYLPSFLLLGAIIPFHDRLTSNRNMASALQGVNVAVVGILAAAFYQPVWVSAIRQPHDAALALFAFVMLAIYKLPPWAIVALCAIGAQALAALPY